MRFPLYSAAWLHKYRISDIAELTTGYITSNLAALDTSVAVEEWLDSVKRAKGTKAKIRNIMSAIFHHAMRYGWVDRNPIMLVRQSAKRERTPEVLELAELQLLLSKLSVRERTLALLDAATGLRVSELLALRWSAVDFQNLELRVTRSIWQQVVGYCKIEASAKPVLMESYMAEDLLLWHRQSTYESDDDSKSGRDEG